MGSDPLVSECSSWSSRRAKFSQEERERGQRASCLSIVLGLYNQRNWFNRKEAGSPRRCCPPRQPASQTSGALLRVATRQVSGALGKVLKLSTRPYLGNLLPNRIDASSLGGDLDLSFLLEQT